MMEDSMDDRLVINEDVVMTNISEALERESESLLEPDSLDMMQASALIDSLDMLPSSPDLPELTNFVLSDSRLPALSDEEAEYLRESTQLKLTEECRRPCWVLIRRLSEDEIRAYTSIGNSKLKENYIRRMEERRNQRMSKFEKYKKNRQNFLQKKRRWSSDVAESSNDEYRPPDSYNRDRKKKKKRINYEDDVDWNPKRDQERIVWKYTAYKNKKNDKLRISSRRRRIETDSDSDSDFDYETYMYDYEEDAQNLEPAAESSDTKDIYDPASPENPPPVKKPTKVKKPKEIKPATQDSMIDNDVLSRILKEMEDYNIKHGKGSKVVKTIFNGGQQSSPRKESNNPQKRKRCGIKVTKSILPPSVCTVQKLLKNMVNTVCTIENKRLKESKLKKCKWCGVNFDARNTKDILCMICKDTVDCTTMTTKHPKKLSGPKTKKQKNKIITKVMKNLPKYEQQRLQYSDAGNVDKGYSHCKTQSPLHEIESSKLEDEDKSITPAAPKSIKKKMKTNEPKIKKPKNTEKKTSLPKVASAKKTNKKKCEKSETAVIDAVPVSAQNLNQGDNNVSVTNVNKGLFLMTFPSPDKELEIPKRDATPALTPQPPTTPVVTMNQVVKQSQYGPLFRTQAPTMVIANYSASNSNNGNYVLSGLYYPNEVNRPTAPRNPLSMPTVNELAMMNPPNSFPFVRPSSVIRHTQMSATPLYVNNGIVSENTSQTLGNNINYPSESEITRLINRCGIQITPANNTLNTNQFNDPLNSSLTLNTNPTQYNSTPIENTSHLLNSNPSEFSTTTIDNSPITLNANPTQYNNTPLENSSLSLNTNPSTFISTSVGSSSLSSDINRLINNCNLQITPAYENSSYEMPPVTPEFGFDGTAQSFEPPKSNDLGLDTNVSENSSQTPNLNLASNANNEESNTNITKIKVSKTPAEEKEAIECRSNLEKEIQELQAVSILSIIDLEKNPRNALLQRIEVNDQHVKELAEKDINSPEYLSALNSKQVLTIAKKWLTRFGSFTRLSEHLLKEDENNQPLKTPLQIKKEHIEEEEEDGGTMSSCQFAEQQQQSLNPATVKVKTVNLNSCLINADFPSINPIANLETQVDSIADQLNASGVDCTLPIPGIAASSILLPHSMSESRETPSRGSGPRTPARPESAASHIEDRVFTPAQIKKEKMEALSSSFSQCVYSGSNQVPAAAQQVSQQLASYSTPSQILSQTNVSQPVTVQSNMAPSVLRTPNLMPRNVAPNVSLMPPSYASAISNQQASISIRTLPQNQQATNFISSSGYTMSTNVPAVAVSSTYSGSQNSVGYLNQVPPNRTVPFNANPNYSKVLMNLVSKPGSQTVNTTGVNSNVIYNNGQQGVYVQPQQQNQVYNVQQVYLPNKTAPLLQQSLQQNPPQSANQQFIIRQQQNPSNTVLVNNNSSNMYSLQNNVVVNYPPQNTANSATALMLNNDKSPEPPVSDMLCALCNKMATLRCKQCAKVAYCDPSCAKTYWHSKHKMECRPII